MNDYFYSLPFLIERAVFHEYPGAKPPPWEFDYDRLCFNLSNEENQ